MVVPISARPWPTRRATVCRCSHSTGPASERSVATLSRVRSETSSTWGGPREPYLRAFAVRTWRPADRVQSAASAPGLAAKAAGASAAPVEQVRTHLSVASFGATTAPAPTEARGLEVGQDDGTGDPSGHR